MHDLRIVLNSLMQHAKTVTLGASALSNPDSLMLSLSSNTLPNVSLASLVDSGSSNSFIDSTFVDIHHLPTHGILPIKLQLMDGSSGSVITQSLELPICFPTREIQNLTFFVTPLDQGCMIVLGYHWLTSFNPMIDWVLGCISFRQPSQPEAKMSSLVEALPPLAPPQSLLEAMNPEFLEPLLPVNNRKPPQVTLINASTYACTCKLEGTQCFQLRISLPEVTGHSTSSTPVNLNALPEDYHDFVDVFSKAKAGKLAEH